MFLVDTNIWLEHLLEQEKSGQVRRFFEKATSDELFISDFSFHSIGVVLTRLHQPKALLQFVRDAFVETGISLIRIEPYETEQILRAVESFNLDFDDAYQYAVAEKYNLTLVSFDADFDQTPRGRKSPDVL